MTRSVARTAILVVLSLLVPAAFAFAGAQHSHESVRSTASGGHHHAGQSQPHPTAATAMPGPSAAQALSGPLPLFPAPPASPFSAASSTYAPRKGISPFLRPRPSIVIGGFALGADAPSDTASPAAGGENALATEMPVAVQPPEVQAPDAHLPGAQAADAASTAAPRVAPVTLYVIPGCYAGDRPPADGMLPAGCDVSKMRSVRSR